MTSWCFGICILCDVLSVSDIVDLTLKEKQMYRLTVCGSNVPRTQRTRRFKNIRFTAVAQPIMTHVTHIDAHNYVTSDFMRSRVGADRVTPAALALRQFAGDRSTEIITYANICRARRDEKFDDNSTTSNGE